ncbi:MAG: hypothetical protein ACFB3T_15420 [Geminicoccaceae bacterium]
MNRALMAVCALLGFSACAERSPLDFIPPEDLLMIEAAERMDAKPSNAEPVDDAITPVEEDGSETSKADEPSGPVSVDAMLDQVRSQAAAEGAVDGETAP